MHTMHKTREITLIGIFAALNIVSRIALQSLPNIKPVTSIIIICVIYFGLSFGIKLTFVTTIVSNMFLGMGTWTFFQILAWVFICLLTQMVVDLYKVFHRKPHLIVMSVFSFLMGYVFGFVVSLEQFMIGGIGLFLSYYSSGFVFDTLHAVGNFAFYLVLYPLLSQVLDRYAKKWLEVRE